MGLFSASAERGGGGEAEATGNGPGQHKSERARACVYYCRSREPFYLPGEQGKRRERERKLKK
jgi:hypothetical protein